MHFSGTASGEDQSSGGSETVSLDRKVVKARLKLTDFAHEPGRILVAGPVSGGTVTVNDSYDNTGSDLQGQETYSGPINESLGNGALLTVNRDACKWMLTVSVEVDNVSFTGDAENPGTVINQDADSRWFDIHKSLSATVSDTGDTWFHSCPRRVVEHGKACFAFDGGWSNDYDLLYRCHSIAPPINCQPSDTPEGLSNLDWTISPTFKK